MDETSETILRALAERSGARVVSDCGRIGFAVGDACLTIDHIAAELLAAREALRAADALAEAAIDVAGIGPGVYMATCRLCDARATGPAGVEVDHSDGCPLPAYLHHAARGAR